MPPAAAAAAAFPLTRSTTTPCCLLKHHPPPNRLSVKLRRVASAALCISTFVLKNPKNFEILPDGCTDQHFHNEHCTLIRQQTTRSATLVLLGWGGMGVGVGGVRGRRMLIYFFPPKNWLFCFQVLQIKLFFVSTSKNCHNSLVCPVGLWSCARHPEGKKEILTKINE